MKNIPLDLPHKQSLAALAERSFSDVVAAKTRERAEEKRENGRLLEGGGAHGSPHP